MTAVKKIGVIYVFRITPVTYQPQRTWLLVTTELTGSNPAAALL